MVMAEWTTHEINSVTVWAVYTGQEGMTGEKWKAVTECKKIWRNCSDGEKDMTVS